MRRYELHHGVRINDNALVDAAVMADRYIADRFLPDKAIDLVDEAAAKLKMEITSKPLALDEIDRKVLQLEMERLSLSKAAPKDKYGPTVLSHTVQVICIAFYPLIALLNINQVLATAGSSKDDKTAGFLWEIRLYSQGVCNSSNDMPLISVACVKNCVPWSCVPAPPHPASKPRMLW